MKKRHILIVLFIALMFVSNSCKDNLFNFDLQNIEADGEWGIPVYNGTISLNDLFKKMDSIDYVHFNENGTLVISFDYEARNVVTMKDLFKIGDQGFDTTGIVDITELPAFNITQVIQFNLNTEDASLRRARIKSGDFSIFFSISNATFAYSAELISDNIINDQGEPVTISLSNTQHQQNISLNNYTIEPEEDGNILFYAHIIVPNSLQLEQIEYTCHVGLQNFSIQNISGLFKAIPFELDTKTAFNFPFERLSLESIQLNGANISIYGQNSICQADGSLNNLYLCGQNGNTSPLITTPIPFNIPISPNQYSFIGNAPIPHFNYNPNLDSLGLKCDFNVNPLGMSAGEIELDENSALNLKFKTEIPANLSINNAVYNDTIDNSLFGQDNLITNQPIEQLTLRIAYTNALPFDLIPSIDFLNSATGQIYSLDLNGFQIHGGYNGIPYQQQPIFIELQSDDAQKIINSDKLILNFRMDTQGNTVEINNSQYIRAAIGAKIKYSNINL